MTLLHIGHSAGLWSPETLAIIFPTVLVLVAFAIRPESLVHRAAMACVRLATLPVRVLRRS